MKTLYTLVGIQHSSLGATIPLKQDMNVLLIREPDNPHDPNAVRVYVDIGYIKAKEAAGLSPKINVPENSLTATEGRIESVSAAVAHIEVEEEV